MECYLRAFLRQATDTFDSRHDLIGLAKESGFYDIVPQTRVADFSAKFGLLHNRWRSEHRYFSERQFLDFMNEANVQAQGDLRGRGDKWKNLSHTVLNIAHGVINQGEKNWNNKFGTP